MGRITLEGTKNDERVQIDPTASQRFASVSENDPQQKSYIDQPTVAPAVGKASSGQGSTFPSRTGASIVSPAAVAQLNSESTASQLPRRFGDYLLLEKIAQGGMGIVYKARQESLNRIVAIKMILAGQLAGKDDIVRFYAEAEAAGKLSHPGVVPIYEVGLLEGQHFFSMGYVDGPSLSQLIVDHPIEPDEAAILTRQTAEAISYAHSQGVIHRDLKPANVLLSKVEASGSNLSNTQRHSRYGQPKVTDFGLAKQIKNGSELTATGQILGTPGYMPPEQAAGRIQDIGPLADVYSLGGILYALTTGHAPFQAATPLDTLIQVLESEPAPPRQLNSKIPPDLETICLKCLQKDMKRRYRSAEELIDDLNRFLDGSPITARPVTTRERVWRWAKKHPAVALLGIFSLGLLLLIAIAAPAVAYRQSKLRMAESIAKDQAILVSGQLEVAKDEAEASHYAASISLAYSQWTQGGLMRARQLLNEAPLRYRDWEWWFLDRICSGNAVPLRGDVSKCPDVAFTAEGRLLAMTRSGSAKQWDIESGVPCNELKLGAAQGSWNRSASRIANWTDSDVLLVDLPQSNLTKSYSRPGVPVVTCKHALDCSSIAILRKSERNTTASQLQERWSIELVDPDTTDKSYTIRDLPSSQNPLLALSPQAEYIAYLADGEKLFWACRNDGWKIRQHVFEGYTATQFTFAPATQATQHHELLTVACSDGLIRIFRLIETEATPKLLEQLPTTGGEVTALAWDSSGRWLAAGGSDRLVAAWLDREPNTRSLFRGVDERINALAFSADSRHFAVASEFGVRAWKLPPLQSLSSASQGYNLRRQDSDVVSISVAPLSQLRVSQDLRTCCVLDESNRIYMVDTNNWRFSEVPIKNWLSGSLKDAPFAPPNFSTGLPLAIQLSRDGRTLACTLSRVIDPGTLDAPVRIKSSVVLWDLISQIPRRILGEHDNLVTCMEFSPDNNSLVVGTGLVEEAKQRVLRLSRNGSRIDERENVLRVWDVLTGLSEFQIHQQSESFTVVEFSPDGTELCSAGAYPSIDIWNWQKKTLARRLKTPAAVFPSDLVWTELPAEISRKSYIQGDIDEPTATPTNTDSTDKRSQSCVVVAGDDGRVRIYDADKGVLYRILEGHTNRATSVESLNQGGRIATSSEDGTVRLWDSVFGIELLSLPHDGRSVRGLGWLPEAQSLLSLSSAGELRIWHAGSDALPDMELWEDIFDRSAVGEEVWSPQIGRWEIETADSLIAQTELFGQQKGVGQVAMARVVLKDRVIPDTSLIEFKLILQEQVALMLMVDNPSFDGEIIELTTAPNPLTQRLGVSVSKRAGLQEYRESVANPTFQMQAGRAYQVKVLRTPSSLTLIVDDQPILRSQMPTALDCGLTLQAVYGRPGSKMEISNLRIRSTKPSIERRDTWAELKKWQAEDILISRLLKRIDENDSWSFELKRFARSRAGSLVEDHTAINQRLRSWLESEDPVDPKSIAAMIELSQFSQKQRGRWQDWMFLAAVYERSGQNQQALAALKQAVELCQQINGWVVPSTWGLVAVCNQRLGRFDAATTALHRANRCTLLTKEDPYWARASLRLKNVFSDRWNETGLSPQSEELLQFLLSNQAKYEELYAPDFTFQRLPGDSVDVAAPVFDRATWIQLGQFIGESGTIGFETGDYMDVQIACDESSARAEFELVQELESVSKTAFSQINWQRQRIVFELRRSSTTNSAWVITKQTIKPIRSKQFGMTLQHDRVGLDAKNRELDNQFQSFEQRPLQELAVLVEQLLLVSRTSDAISVAQHLAEQPQMKSEGLVLLSMAAMQAGDIELARKSAEQAMETSTSVAGPKFLQRLIESKRGVVERVEIGKGFFADIPRTWRLTGRELFIGVENFQIGWLAEPPQNILSMLIKSAGMTPEQFIEQMSSADSILNRKNLEQRRFKVGDIEALWLDYVGLGTGGMIDGKGSVETHQVFTLLFFRDEILLITAASPEAMWSSLSLQFQQMIQSLAQGG